MAAIEFDKDGRLLSIKAAEVNPSQGFRIQTTSRRARGPRGVMVWCHDRHYFSASTGRKVAFMADPLEFQR